MLKNFKITPQDFAGKDVSALPDKPSEAYMTASELKAAFDRSAKEVIAPRFNDLLDMLSGEFGASCIGTADGTPIAEHLVDRSVQDHYLYEANSSGTIFDAALRRMDNLFCLKGNLIGQRGFTGGMDTPLITLDSAFAPDHDVKIPIIAQDMSNALVPAMLTISTSGLISILPNAKVYTADFHVMWMNKEVGA